MPDQPIPAIRPKFLIVCADDFGMNSAIDEAILDLARGGRLSAVSCMPAGPGALADAKTLRELPVDLGLHLDFTEAPGPGGLRLPLPLMIAASYARLLPRARIETAIARQLDAFEARFERPPDYVDGHQHVHQLPGVRQALVALLAARYPQRRPWLRCTRPPAAAALAHRRKARTIARLGARSLQTLAARHGFATNRRLLGVYDFNADLQTYAALLQGWLALAEEGDLLMCHPGREALPQDTIGAQRVREYRVLSDEAFPAWLRRAGVEVGRFKGAGKNNWVERLS